MIRIPEGYAAIKGFPGYFWNIEEKVLYSVKISGELTPLKLQRAYHPPGWQKEIPPGFNVSKHGRRQRLPIHWIMGKLVHDGEIPVRAK